MTKYIKTAVLIICIIAFFAPLTSASNEKAEEATGSGLYAETSSEASGHSSNARPSAQATNRFGSTAANEDTMITKVFKLEHAQASSLGKVISDLCSTDGKAVVDSRTNSVLVTDVPAALDYIEQTISRLDTETPDMQKLAEDLEVMSRIIDKTLSGSFPDHYRVARTFTSIGSHQGCQGIYLKGYGAVFMTSISFPVAEQKPAEKEPAPDDLWQQTRYEISGAPSASTGLSFIGRGDSAKYESEKVEQLKKELLELIGTYAHNIRHLGANENIVVAVRGASDYTYSVAVRRMAKYVVDTGESKELIVEIPEVVSTTGVPKAEVWVKKKEGKLEAKSELEKPELEKPELEKPEALPEAPRTGSPPIAIPAPSTVTVPKPTVPVTGTVIPEPGVGGRTTLIIRVSKSDAEEYRMGRFDLDELGDRTELIQY